MIPIFRKIRKTILGNSKSLNYLGYAFGEIILVVIGILIALSINNWAENRKKQQQRNSYTENLIVDLDKDIKHLEELNVLNTEYEKDGFYLLDFMENKLNLIDTVYLNKTIVHCARIPNATIVYATYNDIMDNINLFNDIELKRLLDNYYVPNEWDALFQNRILQTAWYDYRDEVIKFHSPLLYQDAYKIEKGDTSIIMDNHAKYKVRWEHIKKNKYLKTQLEMILAYRILKRAQFEDEINNAKSILDYIKLNYRHSNDSQDQN